MLLFIAGAAGLYILAVYGKNVRPALSTLFNGSVNTGNIPSIPNLVQNLPNVQAPGTSVTVPAYTMGQGAGVSYA